MPSAWALPDFLPAMASVSAALLVVAFVALWVRVFAAAFFGAAFLAVDSPLAAAFDLVGAAFLAALDLVFVPADFVAGSLAAEVALADFASALTVPVFTALAAARVFFALGLVIFPLSSRVADSAVVEVFSFVRAVTSDLSNYPR